MQADERMVVYVVFGSSLSCPKELIEVSFDRPSVVETTGTPCDERVQKLCAHKLLRHVVEYAHVHFHETLPMTQAYVIVKVRQDGSQIQAPRIPGFLPQQNLRLRPPRSNRSNRSHKVHRFRVFEGIDTGTLRKVDEKNEEVPDAKSVFYRLQERIRAVPAFA